MATTYRNWICYVSICRSSNYPFATVCEKCWIGERRLSKETGPAYLPPSTEESESDSEECSEASWEGRLEAETEATSVAESEAESKAESVVLVGVGGSAVHFARPKSPRSKAARAVARTLWMVDEERARKRVGMAVV